MAEIYNLDGEPVIAAEVTPGEPNPHVVSALEALLERARSGDMQGIAAVYLHTDGATGGVMAGLRNYALIGRMEEVKLDILDDLA
jgi:hypothetical protein